MDFHVAASGIWHVSSNLPLRRLCEGELLEGGVCQAGWCARAWMNLYRQILSFYLSLSIGMTSGRGGRYLDELAARRVLDTLEVMTAIFLPHDRLLMSAGTTPVYYWFVRAASTKSQRFIRQFLIEFDETRKQNRLLSGTHTQSSKIDPELVEFDNLNRSTNDLSSHAGRFRILRIRFAKYLKNFPE